MKLVRILSLLMVILITGGVSAQTAKTVNAEVLPNTAYEGESAENSTYIKLLEKLMQGDKSLDNLNKEEVRIMKKYDPYYPDSYNDMECAWSVIGPGCSWYCGAQYETKVSSSLATQGGNIYSAESGSDDDVRTAWVEGVKGYGIGEYIDFIFRYNAPRVTNVTISNGYNKNATTWKNNSRVKTLNIYENDKLLMIVNLADTRDLQRFDLPHPIPNRKGEDGLSEQEENKPDVCLRMVITEVYKGDKYDDTAISEITFDGLDVHCLLGGTMITMANREKLAVEEIKAGDKVLAWDPVKKRMDRQEVVKIHTARHAAEDMISIHYRLNKEQTLTLTADHPVYSLTGWLSANPAATKNYKRYADTKVEMLNPDATLYRASEDGKRLIKKKIESIKSYKDKEGNTMVNTYTLELEGNGIFFANGFAVGQE